MTSISLQIPDDQLTQSTKCAEYLHVSRAEYIRQAILRRNREIERQWRAKRMAEASRKVRKESMRVNAEFEAIETDV